jgi:thiamine biosynthesis lipoprotein
MTSGSPKSRRAYKPLPLRTRIVLGVMLVLFAAVTIRLYGAKPERPVLRLQGAALGTTWSVKIAGQLDEAAGQRARNEVEARIAAVDAAMSTWRDDSELSRFNASRSTEPFAMSRATLDVFMAAREVSEASSGAFDVTVAPLVGAWGFGASGTPGEPPDPSALEAMRQRVGYELLELDLAAGTLRKQRPDVSADLSALAKGFAVDEVARGLVALGHSAFLVEIGGELRARGTHRDGRDWRVAIEDPEAQGFSIHRVVVLRDQAMATSGDYRNFYERDGKRYSHTIDPRSGAPVRHALASVTVLHPEALRADAWATALSVLGPEEGYDLAERLELAAYLITRIPGGDPERFEARFTAAFEPHLLENPQ